MNKDVFPATGGTNKDSEGIAWGDPLVMPESGLIIIRLNQGSSSNLYDLRARVDGTPSGIVLVSDGPTTSLSNYRAIITMLVAKGDVLRVGVNASNNNAIAYTAGHSLVYFTPFKNG